MQPAPRRLAVDLAAKRVEDLPALLLLLWLLLLWLLLLLFDMPNHVW